MNAEKQIRPSTKTIWSWLSEVKDPEIPVLSLEDLGVLRDIQWVKNQLQITITPTYSGCPAMKTMEEDIEECLKSKGINNLQIKTVLSPAWTTDWMSEDGRKKLKEYGIAPPIGSSVDKSVLTGQYKEVKCPRCNSSNTKMISQFGSTACKALYTCEDCLEPFDYFKCI